MSANQKPVSTGNPIGKPDAKTGIYRNGFGLKTEVLDEIKSDYTSQVVDKLRETGYEAQIGPIRISLAREFGFCYGVDKAIDFAYQTRRMFPEKRIFLTTEIIHNPRVNKRLLDMGIQFLSGQYKGDETYDDVTPEDVVVLPAFGASVSEVELLRKRGCTVVDTTCGSVIHVWKRVEKYAKDGYTAIIHGKYSHEETIGTSSRVTQFPGGHYLIVRDKEEAQLVCDFIEQKVSKDVILTTFAKAVSEGFDPDLHLLKVGVANQTTMLSSESLEIAGMVKVSMIARYGEETSAEHFRSFDTICSATQERQDAVKELIAKKPDLMMVVGGFNSSNTTHLIELADHQCKAYHIEDSGHLISADTIRHKPWHSKTTQDESDWLPAPPALIGFTAGASTPNKAVGDVIHRVIGFYGLQNELDAYLNSNPLSGEAIPPGSKPATGCPTQKL